MEPGVTVWGRAGNSWALPRSCIYRCRASQSDWKVVRSTPGQESEGCQSRGRVPLRRCAAYHYTRTCVLFCQAGGCRNARIRSDPVEMAAGPRRPP